MNFNSKSYWNNRYKNGGNSGDGSYGYLKDYKLDIINNFIQDKNIDSIIDLGCGDGNQIDGLDINKYYGYDVSETIIKKCKELYKNKSNFKFFISNQENYIKSDLGISLDVIYHLVEDHIYKEYLNNLCEYSNKYIIIYSNNYNANTHDPLTNAQYANHVKPRNFTQYINDNFPKWKLDHIIKNKYFGNNGVWSDFFIYSKTL